MMQIQVTDGYITGFATVGGIENGIDVSEDFIHCFNQEKIGFYQFINGQAVLDEFKYQNFLEQNQLQELRFRRETECFPIINRGQAWYNLLTEQQRSELEIWYQAWLDVTKTKTVPQMPVWIKEQGE